jgi:hypothetical protein
MANRYGRRIVKLTEAQAKDLNLVRIDPMTGMPAVDQMGMPQYETSLPIDFSVLKNLTYDLSVDVGQASYWSEQTQVQTADALFDRQVITDPVMYLEMIPDKYIKNKGKIVEALKLQQEQAQLMQQQMMQQQMMMGGEPLPEEADPNVTRGMRDGTDDRGAGDDATQQVYATSKEFYQ